MSRIVKSTLVATSLMLAAVCGAQPTHHAGHVQDGHTSPSESQFQKDMADSMKKMHEDMMSAPMTGNPDIDFAAMMIPHHQGAVDMARIQLRYGKDAQLRTLAEEIIKSQEKEIAEMEIRIQQLKTENTKTSTTAGAATRHH